MVIMVYIDFDCQVQSLPNNTYEHLLLIILGQRSSFYSIFHCYTECNGSHYLLILHMIQSVDQTAEQRVL